MGGSYLRVPPSHVSRHLPLHFQPIRPLALERCRCSSLLFSFWHSLIIFAQLNPETNSKRPSSFIRQLANSLSLLSKDDHLRCWLCVMPAKSGGIFPWAHSSTSLGSNCKHSLRPRPSVRFPLRFRACAVRRVGRVPICCLRANAC